MTTVLVVDDEAPIRLLCRVNLEAEGMTVLEAADGEKGLELARAERPDVVLLDVMMPGRSGWEVAEELLADEATSSIPIIFLTARAEIRDRAKGIDLGGVDYVTKPFNPVELAPLVEDLVRRVESGEAVEGADWSRDADSAKRRIEQNRTVRRTRQPMPDRGVGRHNTGSPGEVLGEDMPTHTEPRHPNGEVAVSEVVAEQHVPRVGPRCAGQVDVDAEPWQEVESAHRVDGGDQSGVPRDRGCAPLGQRTRQSLWRRHDSDQDHSKNG